MMTPSNGNIFRVTGPLCGEFTGPGEFPTQRQVTRSFDVFLDLRLNKRLNKQSWGWWFQTLLRPFWRHRNGSAARFDSHFNDAILPRNVKRKTMQARGRRRILWSALWVLRPCHKYFFLHLLICWWINVGHVFIWKIQVEFKFLHSKMTIAHVGAYICVEKYCGRNKYN